MVGGIVIVGAGAIGGGVGARLFEAGEDVTLVARGEHAAAIRAEGLTLIEPDRSVTLPIPVVTDVSDAPVATADAVFVAVKSQDTGGVLEALEPVADATTRVACFQNGVANEAVVGARYGPTYGVVVMMPAAHLVPGRVAAYASPIPGLFDIGLASGAVDTFAGELATRLGAAGFDARAVPDVMRWKYTKLLMNLGNAVEALCGLDTDGLALVQRARAEGEACLRAAGIDYASAEEERRRRGTLLHVRTIDGARRGGGSSWQSLARGLGSIEADALNGEIVRIGAATGVPTPVNDLVCTRALAAAARRAPAASVPASELLAELGSSG